MTGLNDDVVKTTGLLTSIEGEQKVFESILNDLIDNGVSEVPKMKSKSKVP
jgi:hypothetical protein